MIKVLVNAYACSPSMGSEPGMGWNWCVQISRYCELHIITEGEFKDAIECALPKLEQGKNMHFYYLPVPEKIRKMCWNQGDWWFYYYYAKWQKRALILAKEICMQQQIDIIHQLNMIGFREPGLLWKIDGPIFVWGPIGGLIDIPILYLWKNGKREVLKTLLKKIISAFQIRFSPDVRSAIKRADLLIGATNEEAKSICKIYKKNVVLISETGTFVHDSDVSHSFSESCSLNLLWVGRFILTKQLELALKTMSLLTDLPQIKLHIVGTGLNEKEFKNMASDMGLEKTCIWHGQVKNNEVLQMMRSSDLFFFTSIAEATSTVVLEAISCGLPVLCFDTCGFANVVTEDVGIKIPLSTPQQSIKDFSENIRYLYDHRDKLQRMSKNCHVRAKELSWENKGLQLIDYYKKLIVSKTS